MGVERLKESEGHDELGDASVSVRDEDAEAPSLTESEVAEDAVLAESSASDGELSDAAYSAFDDEGDDSVDGEQEDAAPGISADAADPSEQDAQASGDTDGSEGDSVLEGEASLEAAEPVPSAEREDDGARLEAIEAELEQVPVPSTMKARNDAQLTLTTLRPVQQNDRAPRTESTVFAKLVLKGDEDAAVTVRVHDISASGVRLTVPRSEPVTLDHLLEPELLVRVERDGERRLLQLPCELVRVANFSDTFVDVAFRFRDIELDDATMFHSLRHLLFV